MLSKKNRLDKKSLELVWQRGKTINSEIFGFKFLKNASPAGGRISFIVPKSVAKQAVKRNLLRRRGYAALARSQSGIPQLSGAFIFRKYEDEILSLADDIRKILNKVN